MKSIVPSNLGFYFGGTSDQIAFNMITSASGDYFADSNPPQGAKITKIEVRHGDVVDAIQVYYGSTAMPRHGGPGGSLTTINLASDEYVVALTGTAADYFGARHIAIMNIITNKKKYGPYGTGNYISNPMNFHLGTPPRQRIAAFNGRTARHTSGETYLAAIGVGFIHDPNAIVDSGTVAGGGVQISRVKVSRGSVVDAIQVEWKTSSGQTIVGQKHGGGGPTTGPWAEFTLETGEFICEVRGRSGNAVDQLEFVTNRGRKFGPYGGSGGSPFTFTNLHVVGMFGRGGWSLDQIGFISRATASTRTAARGGSGGSAFEDSIPKDSAVGTQTDVTSSGSCAAVSTSVCGQAGSVDYSATGAVVAGTSYCGIVAAGIGACGAVAGMYGVCAAVAVGAGVCGTDFAGVSGGVATACGTDVVGMSACGIVASSTGICGVVAGGASACAAVVSGVGGCGADVTGTEFCGMEASGTEVCGADAGFQVQGAGICAANLGFCGAVLCVALPIGGNW